MHAVLEVACADVDAAVDVTELHILTLCLLLCNQRSHTGIIGIHAFLHLGRKTCNIVIGIDAVDPVVST